MSAQEAIIYMNSVLDAESKDPQVIEFATEGIYDWDGSKAVFAYEETELTGLPGTRTSLVVSPDNVTLSRVGTMTGTTVFREGEKNMFPLRTPYGQTMLGIRAGKIESSFSEEGGSLLLELITDFDHTNVNKNRIEMKVKKTAPWSI